MAEYIEREKVIDDIGELFTLCHETLPNECGHHFIVEKELETHLDFVRNLPAADVRPVVLCRDCYWWMKQEASIQGRCSCLGMYPTGNWYCANGQKRREEK